MAGNDGEAPQFLAPPAITVLRQEGSESGRMSMERTYSDNIRAERDDLREAAEQTLNVILDLGLDGRIKWVSPSWKQVVGSSPESVEGKPISDILLTNKTVFHDAVESMKKDDSRSRFIRFAVRLGPDSILKPSPEQRPEDDDRTVREDETAVADDENQEEDSEPRDVLSMEGQGIIVYDRSADGEGHVSGNQMNIIHYLF
jgi:serine/threonine-protein kinase RIM15